MANRKPISKKMRFEVFKRDKFTCQYCGRTAPDVILEVDHIKPVAKGGTNDLINLVTSCKDCNRGKGKRELSDDSAVKVQQEQLKELAKKSEQLEMMVKWKDELLELGDREVDFIASYISDTYGVDVSDHGKSNIRIWLKKYSADELVSAIDSAFSKGYEAEKAFCEIPKCAYYNKHPIRWDIRQVLYLRKILLNRIRNVSYPVAYALIERALYQESVPFEDVKTICCTCRTWTEFKERIGEYFTDETDQ
jgi:hypothetical protein